MGDQHKRQMLISRNYQKQGQTNSDDVIQKKSRNLNWIRID